MFYVCEKERERTFKESRPLGIIPAYLCQYTLIQKKNSLHKNAEQPKPISPVFSRLAPQDTELDYKFINLSLFIFKCAAADYFPVSPDGYYPVRQTPPDAAGCNVFYFLFLFREVSRLSCARTCLLILINKCW